MILSCACSLIRVIQYGEWLELAVVDLFKNGTRHKMEKKAPAQSIEHCLVSQVNRRCVLNVRKPV